jgi:hypothetical protein
VHWAALEAVALDSNPGEAGGAGTLQGKVLLVVWFNHGQSSTAGGGGGGAGAVGANGFSSRRQWRRGYCIKHFWQYRTFYAGGGGGGCNNSYTAGTGGSGGGGNGSNSAAAGSNGTANLGGGGGGSGNGNGGAGGSGVVIISYPGSQQFAGGTVTSSGGNTIHTFTSSGSLVPVYGIDYLVVAGGVDTPALQQAAAAALAVIEQGLHLLLQKEQSTR